MSDKDYAVNSVTGLPQVGTISKKPCYLVTVEDGVGKSLTIKRFITIDKPDLLNGFVQVKGIFCDLSDEEISKTFTEVLTKTSKELILDMMFPWHKICSIKSLVFNANKPQTLIK